MYEYLLICSIAENTVKTHPLCQLIFLISDFFKFKNKKKNTGGTLKSLNFIQR